MPLLIVIHFDICPLSPAHAKLAKLLQNAQICLKRFARTLISQH